MSRDELEARKKRAERGWLVDPPPPAVRWYTDEERRLRREAAERRYAHLRDQDRPWVADPTKRAPTGA